MIDKAFIPPERLSRAELQEAFEAAEVCRAIYDAMLYGLVTTTMKFNVRRVDAILDEGKRRGITPRTPLEQRLQEMFGRRG